MKTKSNIRIKTAAEIDILRKAGSILFSIISELERSLKSGMTTKDIDALAEIFIRRANVLPAFKGYHGFPGCACISVNEEVVHGVPGQKIIKDGDVVSIDVGIIHEDYYSDKAVTVGIGNLQPVRQKLLDVTRESLNRGIEQARPGNRLSDISFAVQQYVEKNGFSIVRNYVGHGIGKQLHEEPEIPNFGSPHQGPLLQEGMVFAIEPMVNIGGHQTKVLKDQWTVVTQDGQPSAHFEHTIAITSKGPEILTQ